MVIWSILFVQYWRRATAVYAVRWGSFQSAEDVYLAETGGATRHFIRPAFRGDVRVSMV